MNGSTQTLDVIPPNTARTLDGLFRERVARTPQTAAYREFDPATGTWASWTWAEAAAQVARWQAGLAAEGLQPGDRVAIMLPNCRAWVACEQAALGLSLVIIPLYTNDRPDNVSFILQDGGVRVLLCGGPEHWAALAPIHAQLDGLTRVLTLEHCTLTIPHSRLACVRDWLPATGGTLRTSTADPNALATICYTSGTTGRPKGVMLSHRNVLSNAHAGVSAVPVYTSDLFLSFLPLSHMLERTAGHYIPMMTGAAVAYARSVPQLGEDLVSVRPTTMVSVPRIFERVHAKIQSQLAEKGGLAQRLFRAAVDTGWRRFERRQRRAGWHPSLLAWPLLDRLVARPVRTKLGGRLRLTVCGGAPLAPAIARTFIGLGIDLLQGYGLTEAGPVISVNRLDDNDPASVGAPLPDVDVRTGPDAELQARGPSVMLGYWHNAKATEECVTPDGWLRTGDQARIANSGKIYITGRLKDILVLSNGEKIPPADMELAIALDALVDQVMVIGEGRPYLSAMVVLNPEQWRVLAQAQGLDERDLQSRRAEQAVLERISAQLRDFPGYAQIRRAALTLEPWTVESGLITPTLKLKRARILEQSAEAVARLYLGH